MTRRKGQPDFILIFVTLSLLSLGVIMVFSSSAYGAYLEHGDLYYYLKRQLVWSLLGLGGLVIASVVDYQRLKPLAKPLLGLSLVLLVLVLVMGSASHGASRWLGIGSVSFQPSELIKLAMTLFMALHLSRQRDKVKDFWRGLAPNLLLLGVACGLILLQPDLGTAVVLAGTVYVLMVAAGARAGHLVLLLAGGVAAAGAAIFAAPYRMERFLSFLDPFADPTGSGFQTIQGLLALGSGGPFGVGLGGSRQKLLYVPERHTDFIFAILGEELGFLGAMLVLALFFILLWRGLKIAMAAPDIFGSLLAVGLTGMIVLQAMINIAVVTGSMPVTGITLPFISYGGSSLVFSLASIGLLLSVSRFAGDRG